MTPVSYYTPGEITSPKFAYAFARGCGGTITDEPDLFPGPVALFGTPSLWPVLRAARAQGREWFYGDHGYFGRNTYFRVTWNAYQHDGRGDYAPGRFLTFHRDVKPWRTSGSHVLVCPNSEAYFRLHRMDRDRWLADVLATLRQHTDRELRVRYKHTPLEIKYDLADAWACVSFSSMAAVDALIVGVPVFSLAPFASSARMGLSDLAQIESPIYPDDREPFVWALAANQWTLPEILRGVAWRSLQTTIEAAA